VEKKKINIPDHTVNVGESEPYIIVVSVEKSVWIKRIAAKLFPNYVTNKRMVKLFDAYESLASSAVNFGNHKSVSVGMAIDSDRAYLQLLSQISSGGTFEIVRIVLFSETPKQTDQPFTISYNEAVLWGSGTLMTFADREDSWSKMVAEVKPNEMKVNGAFSLSIPVFFGADLILYVYPKSVT